MNRLALAAIVVLASFPIGCGGPTVAQQAQPAAPTTTGTAASGQEFASPASTPTSASPAQAPAPAHLPTGLAVGQAGTFTGTQPAGSTFADQMRAAQREANKLSNGWTQSIKEWKISAAKKTTQK